MNTQNPVKDNSCNGEYREVRGSFFKLHDAQSVDMFSRKCNCNRELSNSVDVDIHKIYHKSQNNECLFTCTCCEKLSSNAMDFKVYDDAMNPTAADQPRQLSKATHKLSSSFDENQGYNIFHPEFLRQTNIIDHNTGPKNFIHAPTTNATTPRIRKTPTKCSCCDPKPKRTKSRKVRQAHNQRKSNVRDKTNLAMNANKQTENSKPCMLPNLQVAEQNRGTEIRPDDATTQSIMCVSQPVKAMADKKPTQSKETMNSRTDTEITLSTTDSICYKKVSMKRKWNKHKLSHTSLKVYSCDSCNQSFPTLFNFKLRLKRVHKGNSAEIWKICEQSFKGSCQCPKKKQEQIEKDFKSKRNASQNPPVVDMETGSKIENDTRIEARRSKSFSVPNLQIALIPNRTDNAQINSIDNSMCLDSIPQGDNLCKSTECTMTDVEKHTERSPLTSPSLEVIHVLEEPIEYEMQDVRRHLESSSSQVIDVFDKPTECRTAEESTKEELSECNTGAVTETSPFLPAPNVLDETTDREGRSRQLSSNCNIAVENGTNNRTPSNCNNRIETMSCVSSINSSTEFHHGPEIIDLTSCDSDDEDQLRHELEATEPTGVTYICFKCHTEFEMPCQLLEHVDNVHSHYEN